MGIKYGILDNVNIILEDMKKQIKLEDVEFLFLKKKKKKKKKKKN